MCLCVRAHVRSDLEGQCFRSAEWRHMLPIRVNDSSLYQRGAARSVNSPGGRWCGHDRSWPERRATCLFDTCPRRQLHPSHTTRGAFYIYDESFILVCIKLWQKDQNLQDFQQKNSINTVHLSTNINHLLLIRVVRESIPVVTRWEAGRHPGQLITN